MKGILKNKEKDRHLHSPPDPARVLRRPNSNVPHNVVTKHTDNYGPAYGSQDVYPQPSSVPYQRNQQNHELVQDRMDQQARLAIRSHQSDEQQAQRWNQGSALCDKIQDQLSLLITSIDEDLDCPELTAEQSDNPKARGLVLAAKGRAVQKSRPKPSLASAYFSKVWLYSNSRLPPYLPPFKVYVPTYPLLCLAARSSLSAYSSRVEQIERQSVGLNTEPIHVPASSRLGTKSMLIAMKWMDTTNTVVIAIRGSATFADWAVNFRQVPDSPQGFLDDQGNLVHSGFLAVAKAMTSTIAARLEPIVTQDPRQRKGPSLLLTGHSAGGAVASLLFCHMLSQDGTVKSALKDLAGLFRRIHCVTFGAPPLSLLPLHKPESRHMPAEEARRLDKSLFFALINEGDPVVRADRAAIRSLLSLYTSAIPASSSMPPSWRVPRASLSNAGRLVVLRQQPGIRSSKENSQAKIEAVLTSDEQLRELVFGDPLKHSMQLYANRVEALAVEAITAKSIT